MIKRIIVLKITTGGLLGTATSPTDIRAKYIIFFY
jgi:hypothetical protein